jgi:hypothetical protein
MLDYKEYYRVVKKVAKSIYESAKDIANDENTNSATIFYDNHVDDYEEQFIYTDHFELLLHYEIMQNDDVIQCEVNSMKDNDVNIVFK